MLELKNISFERRGRPYIYDTNLRFEKGSMNVLLGPTLSGKTSLMRLMAGLDHPTTGQIIVDDQDVTGMRVQDRRVAMVYQQFINYPSMTVYDNIASALRIQKMSEADIKAAIGKTAEMLHLTPYLDRKPLELSGGQQQRCALARALVKNSKIVLLDEPLANLDYKLREELRSEIPRIFKESGAIFVYATTEPEEALLLGGNTATLHQGRVTQFGPAPQVYHKPVDAITARTYSDPPMNFANVRKSGGEIFFGPEISFDAGDHFGSLENGEYLAGFRPNHLHLQGDHVDTAQLGDTIKLSCRVGISEITGSETFLHVDHGDDRWVALLHGVHNFDPAAQVTLRLDPARIFLFHRDGRMAMPAAYSRGM